MRPLKKRPATAGTVDGAKGSFVAPPYSHDAASSQPPPATMLPPRITAITPHIVAAGLLWRIEFITEFRGDAPAAVIVTTHTMQNYPQFKAAVRRQAGVALPHVAVSVWRARIADHIAARRRA